MYLRFLSKSARAAPSALSVRASAARLHAEGLGRALTAQGSRSLPSTPRAVPGQSLGVRTLRCGLYGVLLYLRFVFWPRQLGFWRWRPLWAGDRGAASCGASAPTHPPSAINGSLTLPARGFPAAGRVAEVSPRAFARCGRPGPVGRFQGFRRLFGLAGCPGCHGASGGDRCAGAGTRDNRGATWEPWTALWHIVVSNRHATALHGLSSSRHLANIYPINTS